MVDGRARSAGDAAPASEPQDLALFQREFPQRVVAGDPRDRGHCGVHGRSHALSRSAAVVFRRGTDGTLVEVSPVLHASGEDAAESELTIFELGVRTSSVNLEDYLVQHGQFIPSDTMKNERLYEVDGADAPVKLVGVNNSGMGVFTRNARCHWGRRDSAFHAMSADGSKVFFSTGVEPSGGPARSGVLNGKGSKNPANPIQLFERVGGTKTIEIKTRLQAAQCGEEIPCPGAPKSRASAVFQGASADVEGVLHDHAPLVGEDGDTTNDLRHGGNGAQRRRGEADADLQRRHIRRDAGRRRGGARGDEHLRRRLARLLRRAGRADGRERTARAGRRGGRRGQPLRLRHHDRDDAIRSELCSGPGTEWHGGRRSMPEQPERPGRRKRTERLGVVGADDRRPARRRPTGASWCSTSTRG